MNILARQFISGVVATLFKPRKARAILGRKKQPEQPPKHVRMTAREVEAMLEDAFAMGAAATQALREFDTQKYVFSGNHFVAESHTETKSAQGAMGEVVAVYYGNVTASFSGLSKMANDYLGCETLRLDGRWFRRIPKRHEHDMETAWQSGWRPNK